AGTWNDWVALGPSALPPHTALTTDIDPVACVCGHDGSSPINCKWAVYVAAVSDGNGGFDSGHIYTNYKNLTDGGPWEGWIPTGFGPTFDAAPAIAVQDANPFLFAIAPSGSI